MFVRQEKGEVVGDVINASLNGILVKTANSIPLDADVDIHIQLDGTNAVNSVKFCGKVIRKDPSEIAIHIDTIDMDSFLVWRDMVNRFHGGASHKNDAPHREAS